MRPTSAASAARRDRENPHPPQPPLSHSGERGGARLKSPRSRLGRCFLLPLSPRGRGGGVRGESQAAAWRLLHRSSTLISSNKANENVNRTTAMAVASA